MKQIKMENRKKRCVNVAMGNLFIISWISAIRFLLADRTHLTGILSLPQRVIRSAVCFFCFVCISAADCYNISTTNVDYRIKILVN